MITHTHTALPKREFAHGAPARILRGLIGLLAATALMSGVAAANERTSLGAGITVIVEPLPTAGGRALAFRIALDTHLGDLAAYDLVELVTLRTDDGALITGPFAWEPESTSSHHRVGLLVLDALPRSTSASATLQLILADVGVPERLFQWTSEELAGLSAPIGRAPRLIFVPVIEDGAIAAIDVETHELAWTLVVSQGSEARTPETAMGIAASLDGRYVYAGDAVRRELVVVDAERRAIVTRIPVSHGLHAIDLSPDGSALWVDGGMDGYAWLSATSIIDTATLEVVRTLAPALGSAAHLSFTPDGAEVWAPSISSNLAWVWEAGTGAVVAAIPLTSAPGTGASPEGTQGLIGFNEIAIAPDGRRAFAVGPDAAIVYAVDVATRSVLGTVRAGERAHGIAVRPDGLEVWTANRNGSVSVIDAERLEVLATIDMGAYANHVSFSRDGAYAFVSRETDVAVIDVAARVLLHDIPVGRGPHEFTSEPPPAPTQAAGGEGG